jgi:DoxX-like family
MNVLLWIVQAALALFCLAGGSYKVFHFDEIAKMLQTMALSRGGWGALGMFEVLCAVLLVVPGFACNSRYQPAGLRRRDGVDGGVRGPRAVRARARGLTPGYYRKRRH